MKKVASLLILVLLCLTFNLLSADQTDFSGVWLQDTTKTKSSGGGGMGGFGGGMGGPPMGGGGGGMGGPPMGGGGGGMGGPPMGGGGGGMGGPPMGFPGMGGRAGGTPATIQNRITIQQTGNQFKFTTVMITNGKEGQPLIAEYNAEGKEQVDLVKTPSAEFKKITTATLKGSELEVKAKTEQAHGPKSSTTYKLSKDGKQLTVTVKSSTLGFNGMANLSERKEVYNKQ